MSETRCGWWCPECADFAVAAVRDGNLAVCPICGTTCRWEEPEPEPQPPVVHIIGPDGRGYASGANAPAPQPPAEPLNRRLARNQPCGCVICYCKDEERCHGCGAKNCGTHPPGKFPNPVFVDEAEQPPGEPRQLDIAGEYSCAVCGPTMKEPCEHWRKIEALAEQPSAVPPPEQVKIVRPRTDTRLVDDDGPCWDRNEAEQTSAVPPPIIEYRDHLKDSGLAQQPVPGTEIQNHSVSSADGGDAREAADELLSSLMEARRVTGMWDGAAERDQVARALDAYARSRCAATESERDELVKFKALAVEWGIGSLADYEALLKSKETAEAANERDLSRLRLIVEGDHAATCPAIHGEVGGVCNCGWDDARIVEMQKREAAEQRVKELEAAYFDDEGIAPDGELRPLVSKLVSRATAADKLREALHRYGTHHSHCPRSKDFGGDEPCDCGFVKALEDTQYPMTDTASKIGESESNVAIPRKEDTHAH